MTNTRLVEALISSSNVTKEDIAKQLNISCDSLQSKIDGESEFTASEMIILKEALRMNQNERDEAFFSDGMAYASEEITEALDMTSGLVKLLDILHTEYGIASVRSLSVEEKYTELCSILPTLKASAQGIQSKIDIVFDALNDSVAYKKHLESAH